MHAAVKMEKSHHQASRIEIVMINDYNFTLIDFSLALLNVKFYMPASFSRYNCDAILTARKFSSNAVIAMTSRKQ